jgi:hypothetical protein
VQVGLAVHESGVVRDQVTDADAERGEIENRKED